MQEAKFIYVVRFWVEPEARAKIMRWLEAGHVAEVVGLPGFLWCRRLDLGQKDDRGWDAYSMVYGLESRAAYDHYFANTAANTARAAKFNKEREPFAHQLRFEHFSGEVDLAVDK